MKKRHRKTVDRIINSVFWDNGIKEKRIDTYLKKICEEYGRRGIKAKFKIVERDKDAYLDSATVKFTLWGECLNASAMFYRCEIDRTWYPRATASSTKEQ